MLLHTRGIVFNSYKYGETSVIAHILTEERGLRSFIASGVRTPKARIPYGLFQTMTIVDLVCYFRDSHQHLHRLKEMRAAVVFQRIPFEVRRGAVALFMAEVCRKAIHEGEEHSSLFAFIETYLRWLDETEYPLANLHLHFLVHLATPLGFQLDVGDADQPFFDWQEGVFLPSPSDGGQSLDASSSTALKRLLLLPVQRCHEVALSRSERRNLLQGLLLFYRHRIPGFHTVHTPDILEMVLK